MSTISYTENLNLTQYSEVDEPVFLNDITRDNALIDTAVTECLETAENAVSTASTAETTATSAMELAETVQTALVTTNENVASLEDRVEQNESDIELLQPAKITALENKIDSNTNLITTLSSEVDSVEATIEAHGERLDALESTAETLTSGLATLNTEFTECCNEVTERLDTIDTEQDTQDDRLDSLETRMTTAETDIDNLQTEDETITAQIEVLSQRVTQLLSDLDPTNIQSALALTQQVISNTTNIATLTTDLNSLEDTVGDGTLVTTAQNVIDAINELAGATTTLDTELSTSSTNAVQNSTIASVVGVGTLETTAQNLIDALNELLEELETVDSREATHYTTLVSAVNSNTSSITDLVTQNGTETLETYSQTLSGAINEIHTELDTVVSSVDSLATVATTGSYNDLVDVPTFATVATTGNYSDLSDTPELATVATSGSYDDLSDTPDLSIYETVTSGNLLRTRVSALEEQNGEETLTTDAQTLSGAVNELDSSVDALVEQNGSETLTTDAQTLSGAVNELDASVDALVEQNGSETLTTDAQTLSGAVNELDSAIDDIEDLLNQDTSGQFVLGNLKVCWGSKSMAASGAVGGDAFTPYYGQSTVTFPFTFDSAPVVFTSTDNNASFWNTCCLSRTTTSCVLSIAGDNISSHVVTWLAIGY